VNNLIENKTDTRIDGEDKKCFSHTVSTSELVFDYGYLSVTTVVVVVVVVTIVAKVVIMREIALLVIAVAAVVVDVTLMVELTNKCLKH
nr:hypothetical protein [Tanacetum cinerariifolium]